MTGAGRTVRIAMSGSVIGFFSGFIVGGTREGFYFAAGFGLLCCLLTGIQSIGRKPVKRTPAKPVTRLPDHAHGDYRHAHLGGNLPHHHEEIHHEDKENRVN